MVRLRSVGVVSCAKISAILHGAMGVLVALSVVIAGLAGLAATPTPQKLGIIGILIVAAIMPFFYALLGFLFGAVSALLYNWSASGHWRNRDGVASGSAGVRSRVSGDESSAVMLPGVIPAIALGNYCGPPLSSEPAAANSWPVSVECHGISRGCCVSHSLRLI